MTFYERETNTRIVRAMEALRERSTYAVVLTRRILAEDGSPIGSPFDSYHHLSQKDALGGSQTFSLMDLGNPISPLPLPLRLKV